MMNKTRIFFTAAQYKKLHTHLFPGDFGEHGAVVLAGLAMIGNEHRLLVRDIVLAEDGAGYIVNDEGHHSLRATFISPLIRRCRNERLVYLAVHNHLSDEFVDFSSVDMESHERGYPALRDIARGMPVGALVLGARSIEMDLWLPNGERTNLDEAVVIGKSIARLYSRPRRNKGQTNTQQFDRQIRMFGKHGQIQLGAASVAVLGLGGIGSLVAEMLGRLGVGRIILVDTDHVEESNLSRLVGATAADAAAKMQKIEIAKRHIRETNGTCEIVCIDGDIAAPSVVEILKSVDYIFLAADSMRARLVVNSLVQQFFVPAVQLGAKVVSTDGEALEDAMSIVRTLRPGDGCLLCSGCIDSTRLAKEMLPDAERRSADYGVEEPNPSVITLNAVSAAHAVNDFLLDFLNLRSRPDADFLHLSHVKVRNPQVTPSHFAGCTECSSIEPTSRFAKGDEMETMALSTFANDKVPA